MNERHGLKWILVRGFVVGVIVLLGGSLNVYVQFRRDMDRHTERLATSSRIADSACGPIEYGESGAGVPVLVIHGAGGGFDQGLLIGEPLGAGYHIIAPSRFGYINTPYPADHSVADQADAYVCLLDTLGIDRAAVIAVSAGGPSALQLAQRHPERVSALVLVAAISDVRPVRDADEGTQNILLTDFIYWAANEAMPDTLLSFFGLNSTAQSHLSATELDRAYGILDAMNPIHARQAGIGYDSIEDNLFDGAAFELETITVRTLVIHAEDDSFVPPKHAHHTAAHIPHAQLALYDEGGHFVMVREEVLAQIRAFIAGSRN